MEVFEAKNGMRFREADDGLSFGGQALQWSTELYPEWKKLGHGGTDYAYGEIAVGSLIYDGLAEYFAHKAGARAKPWLNAKEGEAWVIVCRGVEYPAIFQAGVFGDAGGRWSMDEIEDARRIYPEGDE